MDGELLCLKLRDHYASLVRTLSYVRKKEVYCDATIACDGRFYPVHKFVLSTCSDYFEQMFEVGEQKNMMIVLTDIGCEAIETLLDYMYFGEVNVLQSDLNTFMKAAERLRIKGLAEPSESDQKDKGSEKRTRSQKEENHEAKRKKLSDELYSEHSQDLTGARSNSCQKRSCETAKEYRTENTVVRKYKQLPSEVSVASSVDQCQLEATDVQNAANQDSFAEDNDIELEAFSIKDEPEDYHQVEVFDNSDLYTASKPSVGYLPSGPPLGTSGLGIDHHLHSENFGPTQPVPGPSGLHIWSKEETIRFIETYRKRELIWDPKHLDHYNKVQKQDAWEEIAKENGKSVDDCKRKMEYLLSALRREKMKMKRSTGTGKGARVYKSSWFAFNSMKFIWDKNKPRSTKYSTDMGSWRDSSSNAS